MSSFKKNDLVDNIPPIDMLRLNRLISELQQRSYAVKKSFVMKAMIRLFVDRYVVPTFGNNQPPQWRMDPDAAVREILEISKD